MRHGECQGHHMFSILVQNELLKLKSTLALWMMLLMPLSIVVLTILLTLSKSSTATISAQMFATQSLAFWMLLVQPMYVAIVGVLLLGLEHNHNGWQRLYVLPVSRVALYSAKAMVLLALQIGAALSLLLLVCLSVLALSLTGLVTLNEFSFNHHLNGICKGVIAGLVLLSLQHYLSTRWPSIVVPLVVAVAGCLTIPSVAQSERYWYYDPWTYSMIASLASDEPMQRLAMGLSAAQAMLIFAFGCWDVTRRDFAKAD